jgi:cytoskeletal protein CcmA (bactofilin family)
MSESVIADDLHIKGEVTTTGDVELKGVIEGDITCRTLMIAQDARVEGNARAEKVVVRGSVDGRINGVRVTLTSSAKVQGELICKALSVDEEAYFDGTSQRVDDPLGNPKQISADEHKAAPQSAKSASASSEKIQAAKDTKDAKDSKADKSESDKVRPMITPTT